MTSQNIPLEPRRGKRSLPPEPRRGKRGILAKEFRRRLGGISESGLWRLMRDDPDFPKPGRIGFLRIWDEDRADSYVALKTGSDDAEAA